MRSRSVHTNGTLGKISQNYQMRLFIKQANKCTQDKSGFAACVVACAQTSPISFVDNMITGPGLYYNKYNF